MRSRRLSSELSAEPGQGEALDINTPLPTPKGWTLMGNVKAGDILFDEKGNTCKVQFVTRIMNGRKCFKVSFSDGSNLVTDGDHQWTVYISKHGITTGEETLATKDMIRDYKDGNRNTYSIQVSQPLKTNKQQLPVSPYLLGIWLGDGHSHSAQFTLHKDDKEILGYIQDEGHRINVVDPLKTTWTVRVDQYERGNSICIRGHDINQLGKTKKGYCAECQRQYYLKYKYKNENYLDPIVNEPRTLHKKLSNLGVIQNKHIPDIYLRSSFEQRMSLLQGMMDSDGHITKKGRCEFSTVRKEIADGIQELLASLGIKSTRKKKKTSCTYNGEKVFGECIRFSFLVYNDQPVFRVKRKLDRMKSRIGARTTETERRRIIDISPVPSRPVRCIAVDSPSHLYLAGREMIPTHNTEILLNTIRYHSGFVPDELCFVGSPSSLRKEGENRATY